jgi:hypothetical protein
MGVYVAHIRDMSKAYKSLVRKPERMGHLISPRIRGEVNIKMNRRDGF